ncbi:MULTISPECIES: aldo/keto reductase [unclassified Saccharopolyspora]|uniref:aldo/keto reductase n=1 Tax=unclassified Saccharopolyspora TaxID=2646250 RepID=UPI001CD5D09A|nr:MULTISPECIES: aldo/keto reductase [unclassified Saccharopolyspora]MCA1185043.1 aldo/keto reductase [Saccharopolyspora sp. 6T]MCA1190762.1 aldo/keto reductase [Saccharopolyspora sp. 6V]MCA1226259.1 aldo/keto reductase [Saccharopolyspora sp. 6M]MCA1278226.1 aldo/keto reductase [Saccharopolyspora sp. 7B]
MKTRPLGRTGIAVSPYCLGTMMFGPAGNPDPADCHRIVHRALDAGINFIDTADVYGYGATEPIVGAAIKGRRDEVVLATKFGGPMGDDPNRRGASRRWIVTAVEESLRRLDVDHIDLYQIHHFDPATDLEETLSALTGLITSGKVRAIGSSGFLAADLVEAHLVAELRGLARLRTEQPPYSILARGIEREVLPVCARYGMGVLTWSPLSWGLLTGKYRRPGTPVSPGRARWGPRHMTDEAKHAAVERLAVLAEEAGISLTHLAMSFATTHPHVTSVIIGPRTLPQLDDLLAGRDVVLDDEVLDRIDGIAAPGTDTGVTDVGYRPAPLDDAALRRRPPRDRGAR